MNHTVTISVAPVIAVLDDEADLLNMVAIPVTIVLWLPCWLFFFLSSFRTRLYRTGCALSDYQRGWTVDLALMSAAARSAWRSWAGCPGWSIGTG